MGWNRTPSHQFRDLVRDFERMGLETHNHRISERDFSCMGEETNTESLRFQPYGLGNENVWHRKQLKTPQITPESNRSRNSRRSFNGTKFGGMDRCACPVTVMILSMLYRDFSIVDWWLIVTKLPFGFRYFPELEKSDRTWLKHTSEDIYDIKLSMFCDCSKSK